MSKPTSAKNAQVQSWEDKTIEAIMAYLAVYRRGGCYNDVWFESHLRNQIKHLLQQEINQAKLEERDRMIEKMKCWYEITDFDPTLEDLIDLFNDEHVEPWRKKLTKLKSSLAVCSKMELT